MSTREIVFITGANAGLGFQIVRALSISRKSYDVYLGGRSLSKAQEAAKAATTEYPSSPSKIHPIQIDIGDDESIEKAFNQVKTTFGHIDVLLNNAGI